MTEPSTESSAESFSLAATLGPRIRAALDEEGMTQAELGVALGGVSEKHISRIITGKQAPSLAMLDSIAQVLGRRWTMDLAPIGEPFVELLTKVRELRAQAGWPTDRAIAHQTGILSHETVSQVFRGQQVPTWNKLRAVVITLGGDENDYRLLWVRAANQEPGGPRTGRNRATEATNPVRKVLADLVAEVGALRQEVAELRGGNG